jgi:ABC-type transport system involved in cytochrome c biogenesis permease subunit
LNTYITIAFWLAILTTAVSGLLYIRNFFTVSESERINALASDFAVASFVLMCVSLILQWSYLGVSEFGIPFITRAVYVISLLGAYLLVESLYSSRSAKVKVVGMFVMPFALVLEFYAWAGYRLEHGITPALQSGWVVLHVIFAIISYGAFTIALVMAVLHIVEERRLKNKLSLAKTFKKFPSLETLDSLAYKSVSVGFLFLTLVIIAGTVRAQMLPAWQKFYLDPKIISAGVTWVLFGIYMLARLALGWRGRRANMLIIAGYSLAIFTYLVNYILPTIHQYGRGF